MVRLCQSTVSAHWPAKRGWSSVQIFVVDPHPIFRSGLAAALGLMPDVDGVTEAQEPRLAWQCPELFESPIVLLDCAAPGGVEFIGQVRSTTGASVLVCTSDEREETVGAALREGAAGYLLKASLTHENLQAALAAVASGASVIGDGLLAGVMGAGADGQLSPARTQLTEREQGVLTLIAEGLPTREIAETLSYSERTVKNVLHDVVTKLNARSRSQAVAQAVRGGLI